MLLDDPGGNNLRDDVHTVADVLVGRIGLLVIQDDDHNLRLSILRDVALEFSCKGVSIFFSAELDPFRLLHIHVEG